MLNYAIYAALLRFGIPLEKSRKWLVIRVLMAVREGFEPPEALQLQRFSRPPRSATLPSHLFDLICRKLSGSVA